MKPYVKELIMPEKVKAYSDVTFIMNTGEVMKYTIHPWFLNSVGDLNSRIFTVLGIEDKVAFVKSVVGYEADGDFPDVDSLEDLLKVIKALADYNKPSSVVSEETESKESKEKFTLSVKKHKCLNLNFKL